MLSRRYIKLITFITASLVSHIVTAKPNIILIMTDDQGYGDLSIHGNPIVKTPHLDALAKQSTRLENYHVSPRFPMSAYRAGFPIRHSFSLLTK